MRIIASPDILRHFMFGDFRAGLGAVLVAGALTFTGPGPARAQDGARSAHLAEVLSALPASAAHPDEESDDITFFDVRAGIASLGFAAIGASSSELLARSVSGSILGEAIYYDIDRVWPEIVGFAPLDLHHGVIEGRPPQVLNVMVIAGVTGSEIGAALTGEGFEARDHAIGTVWWRGEDGAVDIEHRNGADPFGWGMGMASRIGLRGNQLIQASSWDGFDLVAAPPEPSLADVPQVQAILAALDAPVFDGRSLVRARFVTAPDHYADPMAPLVDSLDRSDAEIAGIRDRLGLDDAGRLRLPPWTLGLYADLAGGRGSIGALIMVFADRAAAERAAAVIDVAWDTQSLENGRSYAEYFEGRPDFDVTGTAPATLAMILRIPDEADPAPEMQNAAYRRLIEAWYRGDMPFLAPE